MTLSKQDIILQLQREILPLQGFKPPSPGMVVDLGLGPVQSSFPNNIFPTGAMHDFLSSAPEQDAASTGFLAALVGRLMEKGQPCLWIGPPGSIFPPALIRFGISPDKVLFVGIRKEKDVLWALEEALKYEGLSAVVGELQDLSFTASRRLQLAVEKSRVTGFLLRHRPRQTGNVACVARWKITSLPAATVGNKPGIGFPRWNIELINVRNGRPGSWQLEWRDNEFYPIVPDEITLQQPQRKTG